MSDPEIRPHLGLDEIPSSNPLKNLGSGALAVVAAGKQLWKYMSLRNSAGLRFSDKYFHVLGFATAAQTMKDGGVPEFLIRSILTNAGMAKEVFDRFQEDWLDDVSANSAAIEAVIDGEDVCDLAFSIASNYGLRTWDELVAAAAAAGTDPDFWQREYGWALRHGSGFPAIYGPGRLFIQPQYDCRLSPAERAKAYARMGKVPDATMTGPLRVSS